MQIEEARQRLAEKELKLLKGSIDETNRGLVLREPQIASIQAEVSAAEAAVERAELNLDRTHVYAPFDAQVLSRNVNIGSQVSPGDELGQTDWPRRILDHGCRARSPTTLAPVRGFDRPRTTSI